MNWSHSEKSAEISKEKRLRRRTTFLVFLWKRLVAIQKMQKYPNPVLKKLRQQERRPLRQRSKVTSQVSLDCDILNSVQLGEIEQLDFVWDVNYNGSEKKILHARKKTNGPQISKSTFRRSCQHLSIKGIIVLKKCLRAAKFEAWGALLFSRQIKK